MWQKIKDKCLFTTGSGLPRGTGLTRWIRNGPCLLMGFPSEIQNLIPPVQEMDVGQDIFLTEGADPLVEILLPTGDAGFGIDNKSWIADFSLVEEKF
jgi:hypothetical protein